MDGFETQSVVMNVFDFHQRITRRVIHANCRFNFLPDGFGGGKRVVAIPNREQ